MATDVTISAELPAPTRTIPTYTSATGEMSWAQYRHAQPPTTCPTPRTYVNL